MRSGLPGVNYGDAYGLKVIHISGHNRHAVNKGSGRDESVTIGARTGDVERGAPLGNSSINRKDETVERGQNMAIQDRKSTRLNSSHLVISYAVFCLKKKNTAATHRHRHNS